MRRYIESLESRLLLSSIADALAADRAQLAVDMAKFAPTLSADRKAVSLAVSGFKPGRVYEVHLDGVKSAEGDAVLHPEAYYTVNEMP